MPIPAMPPPVLNTGWFGCDAWLGEISALCPTLESSFSVVICSDAVSFHAAGASTKRGVRIVVMVLVAFVFTIAVLATVGVLVE